MQPFALRAVMWGSLASASPADILLQPIFNPVGGYASPSQVFALAVVFVLATSFMGQAIGAWFKHPRLVR